MRSEREIFRFIIVKRGKYFWRVYNKLKSQDNHRKTVFVPFDSFSKIEKYA